MPSSQTRVKTAGCVGFVSECTNSPPMWMPKKEYLIRNFGLSEQEADQWVEEVLNEQPSFNSNAYESNTDADGNTDVGAD